MNKKKSNRTLNLIKFVVFIIALDRKAVILAPVMMREMPLKEIDTPNIFTRKSAPSSKRKENNKRKRNNLTVKTLNKKNKSDFHQLLLFTNSFDNISLVL